MLKIFNLEGYFDAIVSGSDLPAKPNPDVFLVAADALGVSPANCLVIEDSIAGVEGARKAGMSCIAVGTVHSHGELQQADMVIDDFRTPLIAALQTIDWD